MVMEPCLYIILFFFASCLSAQTWQLRGSISSHVDRPELLTINITNPTNQSLHILTLNNLFQTSQVFQPFTVIERKGLAISLTWSRATLNTLEDGDDFHDLPSQASFVRQVNLFDHLSTKSNHLHAFLDLFIRLPQSFYAFAGQCGYDDSTCKPAHAHPELPLIEVPVHAPPLHLRISAPPSPATRLELRQASPSAGVFLNANCQGFQGILLRTSLQVAKYLAQAGLTAAQCVPPNMRDPFSYFFYRNRDEGWVIGCMRAIIASINKQGNPVEITCQDQVGGLCEGSRVSMYAQANDNGLRNYYKIYVCPGFEDRLPASPPVPCSGEPLAMLVLGGVLLHELTHTTSRQAILDYAYGMRRCRALKTNPMNGQCSNKPITNADSYHLMAMAAWQMGLGSPPGYSGQPCDQPGLLP